LVIKGKAEEAEAAGDEGIEDRGVALEDDLALLDVAPTDVVGLLYLGGREEEGEEDEEDVGEDEDLAAEMEEGDPNEGETAPMPAARLEPDGETMLATPY
jgi:hypothetical protein